MMRYQELNLLRFLCAWSVVFHHYLQIFYNFKHDSLVSNYCYYAGEYSVAMFFIISGFVMYIYTNKPQITYKSFMLERILRIAPAYYMFTIIILILVYFNYYSLYAETKITPDYIWKSFLFLPFANKGIGVNSYYPLLTVGWTLIYEMYFYLLFAIALFINKKYSSLICIVLLVISISIMKKHLGHSPKLLFLFIVGMLISMVFHHISISENPKIKILHEKKNIFQISLLVMLSIVLCICYLASTKYIAYKPKTYILVCLMFLIYMLFSRMILNQLRILTVFYKLGKASYSTYLCHSVILIALPHSTLPILILIILATSLLSYVLFENNKYLKLIKSHIYNV